MRRPATLVLEFCVGCLAMACGCSSTSNVQKLLPEGGEASRDSAPAKDATPVVIIDPKNCIPPGAPGYCSPMGGQCDMTGLGMAEICTADLSGTPKHAWYCTLPCAKPGDCHGGATCASTPMGSRCVPKSCAYLLPDGGPSDSGVPEAAVEGGPKDSSADGPGDGSADSGAPG